VSTKIVLDPNIDFMYHLCCTWS